MTDKRRVVTLSLPNLSKMSDEELQRHFFDLDGPWSDVTKEALSRFKTAQLDLNSNWASTARWWTCPGCKREKPKIFRLSPKGILLAKLDWHHDHLQDRLKDMLKSKFGENWAQRVLPATGRLQDRMCALIARFEPGLVCSDCNNVEGRVKAEIKDMSTWFSFSPLEISTLISAGPGKEHAIDFAAARTLYETLLPKLRAREALLEQVVTMIDAGDLDQERSRQPPDTRDLLRTHVIRSFTESGPQRDVHEDIQHFVARSTQRDGAAAAKATKHRGAVEAPSADEVANYDGGGGAEGLWRACPEDWCCPVCNRNKAEILRKSKNTKRKWSGKLLRHTEYVQVERYDETEGTYDDAIDHEVTHIVCSDCASIGPEVKRRYAHLSTGNLLLRIRDMKAVIVARPNQAHEIDWNQAAHWMRQSDYLRLLITIYERERSEAFGCRAQYEDALKHFKDHTKAKAAMIDYWVQVEGLTPEEAEIRIRNLLQRAAFLRKADPGSEIKAIRNPPRQPL